MISSINFGSNIRTYTRRDANNRNVSCYTSMFINDFATLCRKTWQGQYANYGEL